MIEHGPGYSDLDCDEGCCYQHYCKCGALLNEDGPITAQDIYDHVREIYEDGVFPRADSALGVPDRVWTRAGLGIPAETITQAELHSDSNSDTLELE